MNILYLCDEYPPCQHGGIGTITQTLARTMVIMGHNVYVVGFYPYYRKAEKEETDQGVKVFRIFYGSKLQLLISKHNFLGKYINIEKQFNKYISFIKKIIINYDIDIIETPDFVEAFRYSGPRIIKFPNFNIPIVVKLHGSYTYFNFLENNRPPSTSIYTKEKLHLENATAIIAISKFVKAKTISIFNNCKDIFLIYNGISIKLPKQNNANEPNENVIFAGSLEEKKGIFSLIKAWKIVADNIPTAKLIIYGRGSQNIVNQINKIISSYSIKSIYLKGFIKKEILPSIYSSSSCAIFPSYAETFGLAPIEAMSVGCPTIFTKRTSGTEIIENGKDGLLVDPDDIQEIADAILFMLKNRQQAIEIGLNGFNKIKNKFDINLIIQMHIDYYNKILITTHTT